MLTHIDVLGISIRHWFLRKLHSSLVVLEHRLFSMVPNQVIGEMVLDGGGHFIPAGIFGLHTLSLLLSSQAVRDHATEVTRTHTI